MKNPMDVLDSIIRRKAEQEGRELAPEYNEHIAKARAFWEETPLCDFSYMTEDHPATQLHIDCYVCDEHLELAVENVHSRTAPDAEE
jgi:hypothetical protein